MALSDIIELNPTRPVVEVDASQSQEMRNWTQEMTDRINFMIPIKGSGSPEGVVSAKEDRLYRDTAGTASAIMYVKAVDDVAGDTTKGWILI